ncbi:hypothetical protein BD410DRAFT_149457 [Rickenella mellea]|uniref:Uncharacterized protein n=1 Tax=Rickenella mellea TaxID=50990 RepID=A0A4Y7Q9I3_9AGAM|nr:hypothetical protein BD410DRAFT_149457 [Rickenella mellea]
MSQHLLTSSMSESTLSRQSDVSEQLQILALLGHPVGRCADFPPLGRDDERELKLLDSVAICLLGNIPGDIVAVTLDRSPPLTLVLARNGNPIHEDLQASNEFFRLVKSDAPSAKLLRFVMNHSSAKLNTTRRKLALPIDTIYGLLESYEAVSFDDEFPMHNEMFRETRGSVGVRELLKGCLDSIKLHACHELPETVADSDVDAMSCLLITGRILRSSTFSKSVLEASLQYPAIEFLKQLDKLLLYRDAINYIVTSKPFLHRFFPGDKIVHRWVEGPIESTGANTVGLSKTFLGAIQKRVPKFQDIHHFDAQLNNWQDSIVTLVHAHIWLIICHTLHSNALAPDPMKLKHRSIPLQLMGSSEPSCRCCDRWIMEYREHHNVHWRTSSGHGMAYANWALAGIGAIDTAVVSHIPSFVDEKLLEITSGSSTTSNDENIHV